MFRFKCATCDEWHEGMPALGAWAPLAYFGIPAEERDRRCRLRSDTCVIDDTYYFVRGCLEIHVHGAEESFSYGVWVHLAPGDFATVEAAFDAPRRSHIGPFYGWLSADLDIYPPTENLKTLLHLRDDGIRPWIELEPTDHPLAVEQREGITLERLGEIFSYYMRRFGQE